MGVIDRLKASEAEHRAAMERHQRAIDATNIPGIGKSRGCKVAFSFGVMVFILGLLGLIILRSC